MAVVRLLIFLIFSSSLNAADLSDLKTLMSAKEIRCESTTEIISVWKNYKIESKIHKESEGNFTYKNLNFETRRATVIGVLGEDEEFFMPTKSGLHFISHSSVGNPTYTTIFPKKTIRMNIST